MKSAYELAMERLEASDPAPKLSDEQKEEIAAIDKKFQGKIAEKEVFLGGLIEKAQREGSLGEIPELQDQLSRERSRLEREMEEEKEAVRTPAKE